MGVIIVIFGGGGIVTLENLSFTLSSIYGAVTVLLPLGTHSLLQLLFLFLPREAPRALALFPCCIHC